jgi:hypothetical protein
MNPSLFRRPSAILPIAMSLLALAVVVAQLTLHGIAHEADEGSAAHIFQLLLAGQAPIVAFFAVKWLPRDPAQALMMMGLQAAAALLALAPVVIFDL